MKKWKQIIACLGLGLIMAQSWALPWQENPEFANIFKDYAATGTFVVYDVSAKQFIGYNQERADTPYVPASTFKIPNSLIALASGQVQSTEEILPYGGGTHDMKVWERDMTLSEAMKVSNVLIFQGIARRIGMDNMLSFIQKLQYGNMELGQTVDMFWLRGPLKISAIDQTLFLAKLAQNALPIDIKAQENVRQITLIEQGAQWSLHGKTGWYGRDKNNADDKNIGWWVGWIEKDGRIYTFALNLDGEFNTETLEKRILIGKACMRVLGLYPN